MKNALEAYKNLFFLEKYYSSPVGENVKNLLKEIKEALFRRMKHLKDIGAADSDEIEKIGRIIGVDLYDKLTFHR